MSIQIELIDSIYIPQFDFAVSSRFPKKSLTCLDLDLSVSVFLRHHHGLLTTMSPSSLSHVKLLCLRRLTSSKQLVLIMSDS